MSAQQPIFILNDDTERTRGRDATSMNISAAQAVAEAVRTTLGPAGMDKMLVSDKGNVVVTNDGATILDEMDIEHPTAQMVVEVAETQEEEAGDGTTSAVILAGELLDKASDLITQEVHPTSIVSGYQQAAAHAKSVLEDHAIDVSVDDRETLVKIAKTAMTGKGVGASQEQLAELAVDAITAIAEEDRIDLENMKIETIDSGRIDQSEIIEGALISQQIVHDNMPRDVKDAKIAVIDAPLSVRETELDTDVNLSDPDQLDEFVEREQAELTELANRIIDTGANVVFCQEGMDDTVQRLFADAGILAVRRVKNQDVTRVVRATGANLVMRPEDITEDDLGHAGRVVERDLDDKDVLFVEDCAAAESVVLILRGGTKHVVDELERSMEDAFEVIKVTIEDGKVLPGGGAPEAEISLSLREFADGVEGREQLAVTAFADSIEAIPRVLAMNNGFDPIDTLVDLRASHDAGNFNAGIATGEQGITDVWEDGVVEPLRVKTQALTSAEELAELILRIDDVLAASDFAEDDDDGGMGGGMPGGGF